MLAPNLGDVERFTRWRFAPYRRGFVIRVQMYGGKLGRYSQQYRIALGDDDTPAEEIRDDKHPHFRKEVANLDGLVTAFRILASKAASPMRQCNLAVAPALFEDAITITKNDVALWLGFGIDFDQALRKQVGPVEGLKRLAKLGLTPRAIVATGSAWINGHGPEPKLHALFSFAEPIPAAGIERAERLVKSFTEEIGGDPACAECSRVLRLPGSVHPADVDDKGNVISPPSLCAIQYLDAPGQA